MTDSESGTSFSFLLFFPSFPFARCLFSFTYFHSDFLSLSLFTSSSIVFVGLPELFLSFLSLF
jgi:hypothetical protein